MRPDPPVILCLSGHDPGGAGIQADIETAAALGAHAATVITAHTVQDTRNVVRVVAPDLVLLREQVEAVIADAPVRAVKIGLLGAPAQVAFIAGIVERLGVPAVLDPVLRAGGGATLANDELIRQIGAVLLGRVELVTPNASEARRLAPDATGLDACGDALLAAGARNVLITGGDEAGDPVVNHWFAPGRAVRRYAWPRVAGAFHGAGCTLASAIAALRARGLPLAPAIEDAQAYTHRALHAAFAAGRGRLIPGRLP